MVKKIILFLASLTLLGCAALEENKYESNSDVEIIRSDFGILVPAPSGQPIFKASRRIPLQEGQAYGWFVEIKTSKAKIKWREEFILPARPVTWDTQRSTAKHSLSKDGRTLITEQLVAPDNGIISNSWEVVAGDPKGHYRMRIYIEEKLVQVFEFVAE